MLDKIHKIHTLEPPYIVKVTPIGIEAEIEIDGFGQIKNTAFLPPRHEGLEGRVVPIGNLVHHNYFKEVNKTLKGVITIDRDLLDGLNAAKYEEQLVVFEHPRQAINNQLFKHHGMELTYWQYEEVTCSDFNSLVKFLNELIKSGIMPEVIDINGVVLNVEKSNIATGYAVHSNPMVKPDGLIKGMIKLDAYQPPIYKSYVLNNAFNSKDYNGYPVIIIDDLILAARKPRPVVFDNCPVCGHETEHREEGDYCINSDCHPFVEAFLSSISTQSDIAIEVLRDQYSKGELFHYPLDSSIDSQARSEIPIDIFRTFVDILSITSFRQILNHFYRRSKTQNHICPKSAAIDELFIRHICPIRSDDRMVGSRPLIYYHPFNDKMTAMAVGLFDGLSEQTLHLQLRAKGFNITGVAQEATFIIAGFVEDDEFYDYVRAVSNVCVLKTGGNVHSVYEIMKYI